ncbi:hypothetical protein [Duganella sp. HH101]|uniref:hypothetical protein n=1 Tax=Duganella sp. HH101 TaxID=1781066 RepID=UPI000874588D|nr:hypothetical protein [Duganella sp. HH101]
MTISHILLRAGALACLSGAAFAQTPSPDWALRLPQQDRVAFRGVLNLDGAGQGPGTMLYPAPGVAGLLVAIATHGALVNSSRNEEKSKIEVEADKVLLPYQDILTGYGHRELLANALPQTAFGHDRKVIGAEEAGGANWVVESTPVFYMTQDQSALVLENQVQIYKPGAAPKQPSYQNMVRVVSQVREHGDLPAYWHDNLGQELKTESASLMAMSLDIALSHAAEATAAPAPPSAFRTFRYRQGKQEVVERAQLVNEQCGRSLLKTLRGWLMSVPLLNRGAAPASSACETVGKVKPAAG